MKRIFIIISILLILGGFSVSAELVVINSLETDPVSVNILDSEPEYTIMEITLNNYYLDTIEIDKDEYFHLYLPGGGHLLEKGNPELPTKSSSLMIPAKAKMKVEIISSTYTEMYGQIAPSKGSLSRSVNPDDIPYEFSNVYKEDEFYPEDIVSLSDPYILREIRGITFRIVPFTFNPVQSTIRVYEIYYYQSLFWRIWLC